MIARLRHLLHNMVAKTSYQIGNFLRLRSFFCFWEYGNLHMGARMCPKSNAYWRMRISIDFHYCIWVGDGTIFAFRHFKASCHCTRDLTLRTSIWTGIMGWESNRHSLPIAICKQNSYDVWSQRYDMVSFLEKLNVSWNYQAVHAQLEFLSELH